METSAKDLHHSIVHRVSRHFDAQESERISRLILNFLLGTSWADIIADKPLNLGAEEEEKLDQCLRRLESQEPIQYILGVADFHGREFLVNKHVLIPRPETEELVEMIVHRNVLDQPVIFDIGTGSGCIAISLKKEIPHARVFGFDISEGALKVAAENAYLHQVEVGLEKLNIITDDLPEMQIDVLVSNPPYVHWDERNGMGKHVFDHEPHQALFANPSDPTQIYSEIIKKCIPHLTAGAGIYFEINPRSDQEIVGLLKDHHFSQVEVRPDLSGRNRMVTGIWNQGSIKTAG